MFDQCQIVYLFLLVPGPFDEWIRSYVLMRMSTCVFYTQCNAAFIHRQLMRASAALGAQCMMARVVSFTQT
jgi:hypothetical protein